MKTLLFSPYSIDVLRPMFDVIIKTDDQLTRGQTYTDWTAEWYDLVVLFGYRKILSAEEIRSKKNIINMHISLLPWNRGACPNLFSWYEGTPKGVSIHQVTEKVDKGPILVQRTIDFPHNGQETLRTSYDKLQTSIVQLFCDHWWRIRKPDLWITFPQDEHFDGSYHTTIECNELMKHFPLGFDTPVMDIVEFGKPIKVAGDYMGGPWT